MKYACPKCKSTNLRVVVETWATLHQIPVVDVAGEGIDDVELETDANDSLAHEWNENSPMECSDCGHCQISQEFEVSDQHQNCKPSLKKGQK